MSERWRVGEWWVVDGRLSTAPVDGAVELPGAVVLPGLVDAHAHLTFEASTRLGLHGDELVAAQLDLQHRAGVLAVRDAGAKPGVALPASVIASGPFLAPPDFFIASLYDGVDASSVADVARSLIRGGQSWVKLIADYPQGEFNPLAAVLGYPLDVVRGLCEAVHEEGGRVMAHVMAASITDLVEAGVDSIEHGNLAFAEDVHAMAEHGVAWTPTLLTVAGHLEPLAAHVPPVAAILDRQRTTLPLAASLGVTVLTGTDEHPHGALSAEVETLVRYGLPPDSAVAAATTGARSYLGLPGLEHGAPADVVTFARDPRLDVAALAEPVAILRGGTRLA